MPPTLPTWFRVLRAAYSAAHFLSLPLYPLRTAVRPAKRTVLLPRLGRSGNLPNLPSQPPGGAVWIHAVSVGEVNAVRPLVNALASSGAEPIFISTITPTGHRAAQAAFSGLGSVLYFPIDIGFVCERFLDRLRPRLILLAETEIWPNFILAAGERNTPVVVTNGRISDRAFPRYLRMRRLLAPVFAELTHVLARSKEDKERFVALGVPETRVNWVGNLKFDYEPNPQPHHLSLNQTIEALLGKSSEQTKILVCGSTKPPEEEWLLELYGRLRGDHPDLRLVLAPRHPHRGVQIANHASERGWTVVLRSRLADCGGGRPPDIFVLDTVGELAHVYAVADVVFMGGSLVATGGQNIIEPAAYGKPVLFGPHMENFRDVAAAFLERYAAIQVSSPEELEERLRYLLSDSHAREWLGRNARKVIRENQGALNRSLEILRPYLLPTSLRHEVKTKT